MLRIVAFFLALSMAGTAAAKCRLNSDPLRNCEDAMSDWWQGNSSHQSQSSEDIHHRTESLRDTLRDCFDCAMDKVESGFRGAAPTTKSDD
jgi:hypothetical protein